MDLWNHVICHYYILHLRLSVCCCQSVMCSNRYKYFDHLVQLSHVEPFVHLDTGSGPEKWYDITMKIVSQFRMNFVTIHNLFKMHFRNVVKSYQYIFSHIVWHLLGMNYFCWMWLFSALCRNVEIFDVECPTIRDTIVIPLSHVKRYFGRQWLILFDEHRVILDPFQILAEVNRMLVMLPGSLDFVMLLMHSIYMYVYLSAQRK